VRDEVLWYFGAELVTELDALRDGAGGKPKHSGDLAESGTSK